MTKDQIRAFRYMLRKNYPAALFLPNKVVDQLGIKFDTELKSKVDIKTYLKIAPKDVVEIIMNMDHPFKHNGFHPAYVLHFNNWLQEQKKELEQ